MAENNVRLNDGYTGTDKYNQGIHSEGEAVHGHSTNQHKFTAELQGGNKGALATQAANGSTGTANSLMAGAKMNTANASGGNDFLRRTAQHEESGAHAQAGESNAIEGHATDLMSKINYTS